MGNDNSGTTVLALIVGAMLVLVVGLYAGGVFTPKDSASITIETPKVTTTAPSN
jgi:hypothetical protein